MPIYIAVLPNGTEYIDEWTKDNRSISDLCQRQCDEAVRKAGLTTPRKSPQRIEVKIFKLEVRDGEMRRVPEGSYSVLPYSEPMTYTEFDDELNEELEKIPLEFHIFVRNFTNEHAPESNYDSQFNFAKQIISELKPCIADYIKGLKKK